MNFGDYLQFSKTDELIHAENSIVHSDMHA